MATPLVHVLVINWNGLEHLDACFESLLASTYENVRFVLIDNGSTDDSAAHVRARFGTDDRVEFVLLEANRGWSGGNNAGITRALAAGADYIFLLNNDTAVEPNAIEAMVSAMEAARGVGAVAPKMRMFHEPQILNSVGLECSLIGGSWDRGIGRLDDGRWDEEQAVIGACGGAWFIRSSVLAETGLLPEEFEIYLDDLDLNLRIWNAGHEVRTCPQAVVRHKFSATMGTGRGARRKYYLNTRNRFRIILRHFPAGKWRQILPAVVMGECKAIGRAVLSGAWWRLGVHFRAWCASLGYIRRATGERRRRKFAGQHGCRFWGLVQRRPLFCPAVEFPQSGWYEERVVQGRHVRPMARTALLEPGAGELRVRLLNCYPELRPAVVEVWSGDQRLAILSSDAAQETVLATGTSVVEFRALTIFFKEETGENYDCGGWLELGEHTASVQQSDE